jgi:hypothetical protein
LRIQRQQLFLIKIQTDVWHLPKETPDEQKITVCGFPHTVQTADKLGLPQAKFKQKRFAGVSGCGRPA